VKKRRRKKKLDSGNCNNGGLMVPKAKREGLVKRKPAVPRTNFDSLG
jgi:hypothetical protein